MSPSTPQERYWDYLNRSNAARCNELTDAGPLRVGPDRCAQLLGARRDHLKRLVEQITAKGRTPRVCLYARAVGGQPPTASLHAAQDFAEGQGWRVAGRYTDSDDEQRPETRPGWCGVRQRISSGYADGVVVVTHDVISANLDAYEQQLSWFHGRPAFLAVAVPETGRPTGRQW